MKTATAPLARGVLAASLFACSVATAAVIDVNGAFAGGGDGKLPDGWSFHANPIFKPDPAFSAVEGPDGTRALRLYDIEGSAGAALKAGPKIAAGVGDAIVVTGRAKGKGRVLVCHFRETTGRRWNQASLEQAIKIKENEWTDFRSEIRVVDGTNGKTGFVNVILKPTRGADVTFADVKVRRIKLVKPDTGRCERIRTLFEDDFSRSRAGHPPSLRIVEGEFSPGIPEKVKMAKLKVVKPTSLRIGEAMSFPSATNGFFKQGLRIYDLGGGRAVASVKTGLGRFSVVVTETAEGYRCTCLDPGREAGSLALPRGCLPADFTLAVEPDGGFTFAATTLSGTIRRSVSGETDVFDGNRGRTFTSEFRLAPSPRPLVFDELYASWERPCPPRPVPFMPTPDETFDPVASGWPLVFSDDFNGEKIDMSKWYFPAWLVPNSDLVYLDGKGSLIVEARIDEKNPCKVRTGGVWTRQAFRYGYFEARLKFTRRPAWWAAYWMYGVSNNNAFLDGLEIDIFEDYSTRDGSKTISHNMHVIHPGEGGVLKSWSRHSSLKSELDDWHVVGCKWTPFEIALYLDGRLIRTSRGAPVAFSAFSTASCAVPLHAVFSGQSKRSANTPLDPALFPENFEIDEFRAYAWPGAENAPAVSFSSGSRCKAVRTGEEMSFSVTAAEGDSPVKAVYLFDNGYLIDFKTAPPYDFRVPFTEGHYASTQYMEPGVSGRKPPLDGHLHVFRAYAADAKGRIGISEPAVKMSGGLYALPAKGAKDRFLVRSGDAFHADVEREADGPCRVGIRYVAPSSLLFDSKLVVLVDGVERGRIDVPQTEQPPKLLETTVELKRGRQRITFLPIGIFHVYGIEIAGDKR